jgi:hypothetical protein
VEKMPSKKKSSPSDQEILYDKLIATNPKIERKGAANPYTSLNGNMFTLLASIAACHSPSRRRPRSIPQEIQSHSFRSIWNGDGGICRRPRQLARKNARAEEVSRPQLRIRQDAKAETNHKEKTLNQQTQNPIRRTDLVILSKAKDLCIWETPTT